MSFNDNINALQTKDDFVSFVRALKADLIEDKESWTNRDLEHFLEGMASWVEDMDGYYQNRNQPISQQLEWKTFALVLMGAKIYE